MINCDYLYYLVQVAKYGSITTAAEEMHITQPTVSLAIKKLEEQLNLALLDRSFKSAHLTLEGEEVVKYAKEILKYVNKIEELSSNKNNSIMNELSIYTISMLYDIFDEVASDYYKKYPLGKFNLLKLDVHHLEDVFKHDPGAFVVSVFLQDYEVDSDLGYIILDKCKIQVGVQDNSRWIPKEQNTISYKELAKLPLIIVDVGDKENQFATSIMCEELKKYGMTNITYTVPSMNIAIKHIHDDLGVSFSVKSSLLQHALPLGMRSVAVKNAQEFNIILLFKKDTALSAINEVKALIEGAC